MSTTTTTTTTTLRDTIVTETAFIGTKSNSLINVEYSSNGSSSITSSEQLSSQIGRTYHADFTNKAYVSSLNNLASYNIDYYIGNSNVSSNVITTNNGTIIDFYNKYDQSLWGIQSYEGNVIKLNKNDFSIIKKYENFDFP